MIDNKKIDKTNNSCNYLCGKDYLIKKVSEENRKLIEANAILKNKNSELEDKLKQQERQDNLNIERIISKIMQIEEDQQNLDDKIYNIVVEYCSHNIYRVIQELLDGSIH